MKPFLPFAPEHTLNGHTNSINSLAFSPTGSRLASGSEDGSVIIWEPLSGALMYRVAFHSAILSLTWDPRHMYRLFVGCSDGALAICENSETQESTSSILTGTKAPVFTLTVDEYSGYVAIALGSEIHVAKEVAYKYATFKIFPPPSELPLMAEQPDKRIRGRALAFRKRGTELVVAYLNHGVVCWDIGSLEQRWQINPIHSHQIVGHAALSSDKKRIALTNLGDGVDIYSLGRSHPDMRLKHPPLSEEKNIPVQVSWLRDGAAVVSGSSDGDVRIWEIPSGEPIQLLEHEGCIVQAVATFDYSGSTVIATATAETAEDTRIKIWKSKNNVLSRSWRAVKLNLWTRNLALKGAVRSLAEMRVRVLVVLGIIGGFSFIAYCVRNVYELVLISVSFDAEVLIARLLQLHPRDLRLTITAIVRRAALSVIEYLWKKLQDEEERIPEIIYLR